MLSGCNSESVKVYEPEIVYTDVGIDGYVINDTTKHREANGTIDVINNNSWVFTGFTNDLCIDNNSSRCNKSDMNLVDDHKLDNVKYTFEFELVEYNTDNPPYYVIIWQDWRKRNPLDSNGRHPITNIKVKHINGHPYLTTCENSWQWGYDFGDDWDDTDHSLHQENDCNGYYPIEIGVRVNIEFYINPEGAKLVINDKMLSDKKYKTKSLIEDHLAQWGMYWSNEYNPDNNQDNRLVIRIDNFKRYIY